MTQLLTSSALFDRTFDHQARPLAWRTGAVVVGTLLLALSSYVEVPMVPVPITMQTFAVTLIGAVYGWRLGVVTILVWLAQGALGLPVLAGGAAGFHHFVGPTAGYLWAFPIVGAITGRLAQQGWSGRNAGLVVLSMLLGNLTCLGLGTAWLAVLIGWGQAFTLGALPFLVGALLKSALAAATLAAMARASRS